MSSIDNPVAVLGAGSWGTALAISLSKDGRETILWGRDAEQISTSDSLRCNIRYLPDVSFPESLKVSSNLRDTISKSGDIIVVVPSHGFRGMLETLKSLVSGSQRIAWATKGIESGSGKLLHQVAEDVFGPGQAFALISGPTFANEVARGLPTAVTVASNNVDFAEFLATRLRTDTFRIYTSDDIIGVEVGGAVKNVLAIAAGISDGLNYGANARAALVTRSLAEVMRLGIELGARPETLMGLTGLGDLILTCTDNQSRNRRLGLALGQGKSLEDALSEIKQVVEGVQTAREVHELATSRGIDMPITNCVYLILYEGMKPSDAVYELLAREQKSET